MEELFTFLLEFPHIQFVYFYDETWSIHKPKVKHTTKNRDEILTEKKGKKK